MPDEELGNECMFHDISITPGYLYTLYPALFRHMYWWHIFVIVWVAGRRLVGSQLAGHRPNCPELLLWTRSSLIYGVYKCSKEKNMLGTCDISKAIYM